MSKSQSPIEGRTLEFMRGFAAVYVVINHVRGAFFIGGTELLAHRAIEPLSIFDYAAIAALQATSLGTEFVIMFFCVSGMAMAHSIAASSSVSRFYLRRLIRLWPTYLLAIVLAAAVALLMVTVNPANPVAARSAGTLLDPADVGQMLFYLKTQTPLTAQFWSLPYEVIFYILAPALLFTRGVVLLALAASIALSIFAALFVGVTINPAGTVIENFFLNALFWFMSGAAAYHYFDRIPTLKPWVFWSASAALVLFVLVVKFTIGDTNAISNTAMIVLTLLAAKNLPLQVVEFKWTNWGFFSYSIYAFHFALIALISFGMTEIFQIDPKQIRSYFLWVAFVPPILGACWLLYFLAEKPSVDYLGRIKTHLPRLPAQKMPDAVT